MIEKQNSLVTSSPCNGTWGAAGDAGWPKAVRRIEIWSGETSQLGRKHIRKLDASRCRWVVSETICSIDRIRLLDGAYGAAIDGKC